MNFEAGDMIVCVRDYGIVVKVEEFRMTINWYEKVNISSDGMPQTGIYRISNMIKAIDGKQTKLVKASQ